MLTLVFCGFTTESLRRISSRYQIINLINIRVATGNGPSTTTASGNRQNASAYCAPAVLAEDYRHEFGSNFSVPFPSKDAGIILTEVRRR
jgi:hypothetical protein